MDKPHFHYSERKKARMTAPFRGSGKSQKPSNTRPSTPSTVPGTVELRGKGPFLRSLDRIRTRFPKSVILEEKNLRGLGGRAIIRVGDSNGIRIVSTARTENNVDSPTAKFNVGDTWEASYGSLARYPASYMVSSFYIEPRLIAGGRTPLEAVQNLLRLV